MPRAENVLTIQRSIELMQLMRAVQHDQKLNKLHESFYMARNYLIQYKEKFIEMYGEEKYKKEVARWSRTRIEIRDTNIKAEAEKIERREAELRRKNEALAIERLKAEAYNRQTNSSNEGRIPRPKCPKCKSNKKVGGNGNYNPNKPLDNRNMPYYCSSCKKNFGV